MDILDKAYDYIDYTLEQLAKTQESSVSLLYFFKLSSTAGKLAKHLLIEHSFIEVDSNHALAVIGITQKGRDVVSMGGIRKYLDYLDMLAMNDKNRLKKIKRIMIAAGCAAGSAIVFFVLKNRLIVKRNGLRLA